MMRKIIVLVVLALIGLGGWFWWHSRNGAEKTTQYRLDTLTRRDLVQTVSATGTLSAVTTVEVGSEISGQIQALLVDYNSPVTKDQIIARIDPLSYEAQVRQAKAELALAEANRKTQIASIPRYQAEHQSAVDKLAAAQAQTRRAEVTLTDAQRNFDRKKMLVDKAYIARNEFDAAETALAEARAALEQIKAQQNAARNAVAAAQAALVTAEAKIAEADATIELRQAALEKRLIDLEHTIIRSPVDGVVIDRSVDVGQTVAASLQAPKLFVIAQDLRKMQVSTAVDEADIGRIKEDQAASFTVDAFGSRKFAGSVLQIRKQGETVQNVVTYTVIISAENPDLSLMPNMTANVDIEVQRLSQVLSVANAALRYKPSNASLAGASGSVPMAEADGGEAQKAIRERFAKLAEALEMDAQQRDQMKQAFAKLRQRAREEQQVGAGMPMRRGGLRDRFRQEMNTIFKRILTPGQWTRYQQIMAGRDSQRGTPGTVWVLDEGGQPTPLAVMVGVNDGSFAAIRGQALKEGMSVIVGEQND